MWIVTQLLLSVTLKFFYFLILSPDHLLLISAHVLCHAPPTCLQEHHFIQSEGGYSHGGSQDICEDAHPLHYGTIRLLSVLFAPQESSSPLLLWASSQPKGVAKPRGTMVVGGGDGMLSPQQPVLLLLLWDSCPLVDWCWEFDSTCPGPGVFSAGVWPILVHIRFYSTQPCLPALLRRIQVRPLYWGKQVSLVAPWYVWLYTFVCGACSSVLVCWCSEKEAWVSMYKKVFRARHNDVDLLMSTRIDIISMSVTDPKYPGFSSL